MFYVEANNARVRVGGTVHHADHEATVSASRTQLQPILDLLGDGYGDVVFDAVLQNGTRLSECHMRSIGPPMRFFYMGET